MRCAFSEKNAGEIYNDIFYSTRMVKLGRMACVALIGLSAIRVEGQSISDHVVVKFKPDAVRKRISVGDTTPLKTVASLLKLPRGAVLDETGFAKWVKGEHKRKKLPEPDVDWSRLMLIHLPCGFSTEQCKKLLKDNPLVERVDVESVAKGGGSYPDDPFFQAGTQWYLAGPTGNVGRIHAPEAWDLTTGSSNIIVAVLDTGCNTNLPEFAGRWVPGWDFVNGDADPMDDNGHGTKVASIICANADNGLYGAGVDWNCKLMPVKVLTAGNTGFDTPCIDGINWAVTNGAKIINLSAGGYMTWTNEMRDAITNAIAQGVIFVTIAHNSGSYGSIPFPGSMPEVITVGASDTNGARCIFSLYGPSLDLLAPGTNIFCLTTNSWMMDWGTSFSAPQVSGVAALMCALRPELNNQQVQALLCAGAEYPVSPTNGWDQYVGWGVLNAYNSVMLAKMGLGGMDVAADGTVSLSWACPSNAVNRQPFGVEYATSLTGAWTVVSNISYGVTNATWTDTDPSVITTRFYRVNVRNF